MNEPTIAQTRATLKISRSKMALLMGMRYEGVRRVEVGERVETKKDRQMCRALLVLHRHGLLGEIENGYRRD